MTPEEVETNPEAEFEAVWNPRGNDVDILEDLVRVLVIVDDAGAIFLRLVRQRWQLSFIESHRTA